MAQFGYDAYRSPYAESIAESIAAPGRAQAQGVLNAGAAQAQGAQQQGQIWGQAIGNLGQIAGQAIQIYNSPASKLTRVMKQTPKIDLGNGVMGYDVGTIADALAKQGANPTEAAKHLSDINESFQQVAAVKLAAVTRGAVALRAAGGDPELALDFLDTVEKNHLYPPAQTAHLRALIKANPTPETVNKILTLFAGPEKFENAPAGSMARNATTGAVVPGTMVPEKPVAPTRASLAAAAAGGDPSAQSALNLLTPVPPPTGATLDARAQELYGKKAQGVTLTKPEQAELTAYEERKRVISDPAATAAADRQATATAAATAQQQRSQTFTEQQVGRKELTDKVEQPYQTAQNSANALRDVVASATAGNKVAGSLQSLETTMAAIRAQGLNRINMAEIGVTARAGSLWDRLQGWFGKADQGQPVPPDIQKDMIEFANILERAAYQKYADGFKATTGRYKLTDEKILPPPGPHVVRDANGKLVPQ